jgi:hypothetical protein
MDRSLRMSLEVLTVTGVFALVTALLGWMIATVCAILTIVGLFLLADK